MGRVFCIKWSFCKLFASQVSLLIASENFVAFIGKFLPSLAIALEKARFELFRRLSIL